MEDCRVASECSSAGTDFPAHQASGILSAQSVETGLPPVTVSLAQVSEVTTKSEGSFEATLQDEEVTPSGEAATDMAPGGEHIQPSVQPSATQSKNKQPSDSAEQGSNSCKTEFEALVEAVNGETNESPSPSYVSQLLPSVEGLTGEGSASVGDNEESNEQNEEIETRENQEHQGNVEESEKGMEEEPCTSLGEGREKDPPSSAPVRKQRTAKSRKTVSSVKVAALGEQLAAFPRLRMSSRVVLCGDTSPLSSADLPRWHAGAESYTEVIHSPWRPARLRALCEGACVTVGIFGEGEGDSGHRCAEELLYAARLPRPASDCSVCAQPIVCLAYNITGM